MEGNSHFALKEHMPLSTSGSKGVSLASPLSHAVYNCMQDVFGPRGHVMSGSTKASAQTRLARTVVQSFCGCEALSRVLHEQAVHNANGECEISTNSAHTSYGRTAYREMRSRADSDTGSAAGKKAPYPLRTMGRKPLRILAKIRSSVKGSM